MLQTTISLSFVALKIDAHIRLQSEKLLSTAVRVSVCACGPLIFS